MAAPPPPPEACPRCGQARHVIEKLLLIDTSHGHAAQTQSIWRAGCACHGVSVDDLKPEFTNQGQFIQGLYCEVCTVGFVPERLAKPEPPMFQGGPDGFRRLLPDGTLGPLLARMSDDPDWQC